MSMLQQKASGRMAQRAAAPVPAVVAKVAATGRARLSVRAQAVAAPVLANDMVTKCVNAIRFVAIGERASGEGPLDV